MIEVLWRGRCDYADCLGAMRAFTDARNADTVDQLWVVEHPPVFTQGQAGRPEHLLLASEIGLQQSDRGGQITYHGPGQIVIYTLIDLLRRGYGIRELVSRIEQSMIDALASCGIAAYADAAAPGVYVDIDGQRHKIGSLGLRVRRGRSYHGLALNNAMDLSPFLQINPCGYAGLPMTQVSALSTVDPASVPQRLVEALLARL